MTSYDNIHDNQWLWCNSRYRLWILWYNSSGFWCHQRLLTGSHKLSPTSETTGKCRVFCGRLTQKSWDYGSSSSNTSKKTNMEPENDASNKNLSSKGSFSDYMLVFRGSKLSFFCSVGGWNMKSKHMAFFRWVRATKVPVAPAKEAIAWPR